MSCDDFGDRMKEFEQMEAGRKFLPMLPIVARLDGKGFSKYTKDLERTPEKPFSEEFQRCMIETTKFLTDETCANMAYCQSDEISLTWYSPSYESQIWFNGKIQKMNSVLASMASAFFNPIANELLPVKKTKGKTKRPLAFFDCRIWQLPNLMEATNAILWREQDASKNSISMAARTMYSHKQLFEKSGSEMQEMMFQKGINWNNYPTAFKRGTFIQRRSRTRMLTQEELNRIPEKFRPTTPVERTEIVELDMPKFSTVTNRVDVVFFGADAKVEGEIK